ncbi:hypothetical protein F5Y13DRAFT_205013 [Hypoxylon sp. FL1857]|nr:hypothetical protein F5Y13DRAFT_205013 [Hypoxylon sp. FL1857]
MPKRGIKRKAGLQLDSGNESDDLLVQDDTSKRTKLKGKSKRLSRLEEYVEDEGREGSRNFQRWAEIFESNTKGEAMKSKTFMKNFGAKVKKQTDRVRDYMQEQEKKLTENQDQFAEVFEKLYSAAVLPPGRPNKSDGKAGSASKDSHVLFKDAQDVISGGYSLLKQFKETDERLKNFKIELPTAKWKQDKRDIKELLTCGREVGEKLVEEKLASRRYPSPQPDRYKANEKENAANELFKDSRKTSDGDNWGVVAADQVKKLAAIAQIVPIKGSERARH